MAFTTCAPHVFDVARFVLNIDCTTISAFQRAPTRDKVGSVFMVLSTCRIWAQRGRDWLSEVTERHGIGMTNPAIACYAM
jgi:hypothetical protein